MIKNNFFSVLSLAWELGYTIAIPIAVLGFGGAWLDKKWGTSPAFLLLGVIFAVVLSSIGIYRKMKQFIR